MKSEMNVTKSKMSWVKIIVLGVIFIACVARGIPDSILGSAWPAMRTDLALPDIRLGIVMLIIAACIILTNLFGTRILSRIRTEIVSLVSIAMIAISFFLFTRVQEFWQICLLGAPIGVATGMIEQAVNNYVALNYPEKYMNYLHCFIGLGIICSPYLMSIALVGNAWRNGFFTAFMIEAIVAVLMIPTFPLWKKARTNQSTEETVQTENVPFYELLKERSMQWLVVALFLTNVIEYTCGTWGCTYLVEAKNFSEADAAKFITVFYLGMTIGRFTSGLIAEKMTASKRIAWMTMIAAVGVALIVLPLPESVTVVALFILGLGNGPVYPSLISVTPYAFGKERTGSAMGVEIAAAFFAVMVTPILYSFIKGYLQNTTFILFLMISVMVMAFSSMMFFRRLGNKKNN